MTTIDTGDHVRHGPTGETWVVARVDGQHLYWQGWPPGRADLKDCTLIDKATPARRARNLESLAESEHSCAGWAADRLKQERAAAIGEQGDGNGAATGEPTK